MTHPSQSFRRRLTSQEQHKPGPGLAFRPGTRRPRRRLAPKGHHVKISFPADRSRTDGSPLPPHARAREPLKQARPMSHDEREDRYAMRGPNPPQRLTPAQERRLRKKQNHTQHASERAKIRAAAAAKRAERRSANWMAQLMGRRDA